MRMIYKLLFTEYFPPSARKWKLQSNLPTFVPQNLLLLTNHSMLGEYVPSSWSLSSPSRKQQILWQCEEVSWSENFYLLLLHPRDLHPFSSISIFLFVGLLPYQLLPLTLYCVWFYSTAAATFRQAVALIFDHVVRAESLPTGKCGSGGYTSRSTSVTSDVNRNINKLEYAIFWYQSCFSWCLYIFSFVWFIFSSPKCAYW